MGPVFCCMLTIKVLTSLSIRTVRSAPLLLPLWKVYYLNLLHISIFLQILLQDGTLKH